MRRPAGFRHHIAKVHGLHLFATGGAVTTVATVATVAAVTTEAATVSIDAARLIQG